MQDLNDMVFFAEVAERGGFAAASRALGIPKSRLSRRVADLEERLGVQLMQRSTRRLSLTPAGEIYSAPRRRHARRGAGGGRGGGAGADRAQRAGAPERAGDHVAQRPGAADAAVHGAVPGGAHRHAGDQPAGRPDRGGHRHRAARAPGHRGQRAAGGPHLRHQPGRAGGHARPAGAARPDRVAGRPGAGYRRPPCRSPARGAPNGASKGPTAKPACMRTTRATWRTTSSRCSTAPWAAWAPAMLPDYMCRAEIEAGRLSRVLPGWGPSPVVAHMVFPARRALVPAVRRLIDFLVEHLQNEELRMF
jgi:DNA-binding transcriptional LysR family regulator